MNNLPLITQFLLVGLGSFIIGILLGMLLKRGNRQQQAELEQAKQALQDYREAVDHHFADTADAVDELTRSYQQVFAQLSRGAEELMTPEAYRRQIEQRSNHTVTLSYLAEGAAGGNSGQAAEPRIQLVPDDAPVPPQNDLDEAGSAADAAPVFNTDVAAEATPAAEAAGGHAETGDAAQADSEHHAEGHHGGQSSPAA